MDCFASLATTSRSAKFGDDLDLADDRSVEGSHFVRGNPVFQMHGPADILNLVFVQKRTPHIETCNVTGAAGRNVPVSSNFDGIVFREHGIENWLVREPRREFPHSAFLDQFKFSRSNRTPQRYNAF